MAKRKRKRHYKGPDLTGHVDLNPGDKFEITLGEIDDNGVFAHVFAFAQRCRDLVEVCEGRMQFAPRYASEGGATTQPVFRGPRGTQVEKDLEDIEASFAKAAQTEAAKEKAGEEVLAALSVSHQSIL